MTTAVTTDREFFFRFRYSDGPVFTLVTVTRMLGNLDSLVSWATKSQPPERRSPSTRSQYSCTALGTVVPSGLNHRRVTTDGGEGVA